VAAPDGCASVPGPDKRWKKVHLKHRVPYLYISVFNARQGELSTNGTRYLSTNGDSVASGHGISIVRQTSEKNGGFAIFEDSEEAFHAEVALPADN